MSLLPKQQKLIEIIIDNYGKRGKRKTLGEMIIEAGYSETTAINPKLIITEEMQEHLTPVISKMVEVRTLALDNVTEDKLKAGNARDNVYVADLMTKNIQLLSGGNTGKIAIDDGLTQEQKDKLLGLL